MSRVLVGLAVAGLLHGGLTAEAEEPQKKRGLTSRMLDIFRGDPSRTDKHGVVHTRYLSLKMEVTPLSFKLGETRKLNVSLQLLNKSKKFIDLEFPTTQRIEVLVRDAQGKVVQTWSEDQSFTSDTSHVTINPSERVEYMASVATREMVAGQTYTVEAFFPNFEELRVKKAVKPEA